MSKHEWPKATWVENLRKLQAMTDDELRELVESEPRIKARMRAGYESEPPSAWLVNILGTVNCLHMNEEEHEERETNIRAWFR